jgi:hypothetical protein
MSTTKHRRSNPHQGTLPAWFGTPFAFFTGYSGPLQLNLSGIYISASETHECVIYTRALLKLLRNAYHR